MKGIEGKNKWLFSGVLARRIETWDLIRGLRPLGDTPWLVFGELNENLTLSEKEGGRDRIDRQMESFREALANHALGDLGSKGAPFTWCNNWEGEQRILGRFLCK